MRKTLLVFCIIISCASASKCQSNDTLAARIIQIISLKECLLIKVVSINKTDTSVLISPIDIAFDSTNRTKLLVGKPYTFVSEKDLVFANPTKRWSVGFKNTTVWTNKEPYKLKPRLCLNCIGKYLK